MCNSKGNKHTGLVSLCESKSAGEQPTDQLVCVACVIKLQLLLQQSTGHLFWQPSSWHTHASHAETDLGCIQPLTLAETYHRNAFLLKTCTNDWKEMGKLNRITREGQLETKTGRDDKADDAGSRFCSNTSCCRVNTFRAVFVHAPLVQC